MRVRAAVVFGVVLAMAGGVRADEPDPAEAAKAWAAYATPGKAHEQLGRLVGQWDCVVKDFYMNPEEPFIAKGSATFKAILGGRYVQQHFKSTLGGQPFEGVGLAGFDNGKKKFFGTWVDNMGTGIMHSHGTYDAATHTLTEHGKSETPMGTMVMKMITKYESQDAFRFTMYSIEKGKERKIMEIAYERKK